MTTSTVQVPSRDRPEPIRDALAQVARGIAGIVGLVAAVGSFVGLSTTQIEAISTYGSEVNETLPLITSPLIGLVAGGSALWGILAAGRHATGNSTPSDDPRDRDGTALMRVDGKPLGGIEPAPVYFDGEGRPTSTDPSTETFTRG